jgi:hypothetical protein
MKQGLGDNRRFARDVCPLEGRALFCREEGAMVALAEQAMAQVEKREARSHEQTGQVGGSEERRRFGNRGEAFEHSHEAAWKVSSACSSGRQHHSAARSVASR